MLLLACVAPFEVRDGTHPCAKHEDCLDGRYCSPLDGTCQSVEIPGDCGEDELPVVPCSGSLAGTDGRIPTFHRDGHLTFFAANRMSRVDAQGRCVAEHHLPLTGEADETVISPDASQGPAVAGILDEEKLFLWRPHQGSVNTLPVGSTARLTSLATDAERTMLSLHYKNHDTNSSLTALDDETLTFDDDLPSLVTGCEPNAVGALTCHGGNCDKPFAALRSTCLDGRQRFELRTMHKPTQPRKWTELLRSWTEVEGGRIVSIRFLHVEEPGAVLLAGSMNGTGNCTVWRARWGDSPSNTVLMDYAAPCTAMRKLGNDIVVVAKNDNSRTALRLVDGETSPQTIKEAPGGFPGGAISDTGDVWLLRRVTRGLCMSRLEWNPDG